MRPHLVHWLEHLLPAAAAQLLAPSWFTCVGLAGLVALFWMLALARRHNLDRVAIAAIVLWCYLAAVTAGIAMPMAIDTVEQLVTTGRFELHWAGMTSFWGYLAGTAATALVCRAHRLPLARLGDLAAAPLGISLVLARLGCFIAGCDYGKVTSLPWAMRFPSGSPAWRDQVAAGLVPADRAESLPVHPTQLYEAALGLVIFAVATLLANRRWSRREQPATPELGSAIQTPSSEKLVQRDRRPSLNERPWLGRDGQIFLSCAAIYAIGRIAIETLRGDDSRGIYFGLSSAQIFSLLVLAAIGSRSLLRRSQLAAAVTTALTLLIIEPSHADAQPAGPVAGPPPPAGPVVGPPPPAGPVVGPPPPAGPPAPSAVPVAGPRAPTSSAPGAAASPAAEAASESSLHIGALVGFATPLNRRADQVPMLGGPSISIGLGLRNMALWLDLDSYGNTDATHGTVMLSGSVMAPVANHLQIGGRAGLGATLVNFDDPAFRDVVGTTVRVEAVADYAIGEQWSIWLRPLSFDLLTAAALGGPILTWQARIGVAYHMSLGRRGPPAPAAANPTRSP